MRKPNINREFASPKKLPDEYSFCPENFELPFDLDTATITTWIITDMATYWSQIVLTISVAIERYIIIVKGLESKIILSPTRLESMTRFFKN